MKKKSELVVKKMAMHKESFGESIIEGLTDLVEALENGVSITERFTCRRIVLDLEPTPYDPEMVKKTRAILNASQAVFAQFLGVSPKTIQAWESGHNTPNDMAGRFMDEIRRDPTYWRDRFTAIVVKKGSRSKKPAATK